MWWVIWHAWQRRVAVWNRAEQIHLAQDRDKWHTLVNNNVVSFK
jgi:hypothetical protein